MRVTLSVPAAAKVGDIQRVSIVVNSDTAPDTDSAQIAIVAAGQPSVHALSVGAVNLGQVTVGQTGARNAIVVVTNSGNSPVDLSRAAVTGDFSQTNTCGATLAAGSSCIFQIMFSPTAPGIRTGTLKLNDASPGAPHVLALQCTATAAIVVPRVNAAGSAPGISPGALFTIYGLNLSDGPAGVVSLPLPSVLGGTSITIGGVPAAMLYADANQINAQVPFELQPGEVGFTLTTSTGTLTDGTITIGAVSPGLFMIPNTSHAAAQNQDLSPNLAQTPVPAGGIVVVYFTGQGQLDQLIATGAASPSSPPANVTANVVVPATQADGTPLPAGHYPLILSVGGLSTTAANISVGPQQQP